MNDETFSFFQPKTHNNNVNGECAAEDKQINNFSLFHTAHEWNTAVQTNTDVDDDKASRSFVVSTDMNEESEKQLKHFCFRFFT